MSEKVDANLNPEPIPEPLRDILPAQAHRVSGNHHQEPRPVVPSEPLPKKYLVKGKQAPSIFAPMTEIYRYYGAARQTTQSKSTTPHPQTETPWFDPKVSTPDNADFFKKLQSSETSVREIALEHLARIYQGNPQGVFHSLSNELTPDEFFSLLDRKPHTKDVTKCLEGLELQLAFQGIEKYEQGKNPTRLERWAMEKRLPVMGPIRKAAATTPYPNSFHILAKGKRAFQPPKTENKLNFPWFYDHHEQTEALLRDPAQGDLTKLQPNRMNPRLWHGLGPTRRRQFIKSLKGIKVARVFRKPGDGYDVSAETAFALKLWEGGDRKGFLQAVAAGPEGMEHHLPKGAAKYLAHNLDALIKEMSFSQGSWSADEAVMLSKLLRLHLKENVGSDPENLSLAVQRLTRTLTQNLSPTPQHVGTLTGVVLGALFLHVKGIKAGDEAKIALLNKVAWGFGTFGGTYGKAFSMVIKGAVVLGLYKIRDHKALANRLRGTVEWNWTRENPPEMQDPKTGEMRKDAEFGLIAARRMDATLHLLDQE